MVVGGGEVQSPEKWRGSYDTDVNVGDRARKKISEALYQQGIFQVAGSLPNGANYTSVSK